MDFKHKKGRSNERPVFLPGFDRLHSKRAYLKSAAHKYLFMPATYFYSNRGIAIVVVRDGLRSKNFFCCDRVECLHLGPNATKKNWANKPNPSRSTNPQHQDHTKTKIATQKDCYFLSGYQDSNLGPPAPKAGALTGLRYIPSV